MPSFDKPQYAMQNDPMQSNYGMFLAFTHFWLNEGDEGYEDYFEDMLDIGEGYNGEMKDREPVDKEDYEKWFSSLSIIKVKKPLCGYGIHPPHTITPEGVLWCFQYALDEIYRMHCRGEELRDINLPYEKTSLYKTQCELAVASLSIADYKAVPNKELYKVSL